MRLRAIMPTTATMMAPITDAISRRFAFRACPSSVPEIPPAPIQDGGHDPHVLVSGMMARAIKPTMNPTMIMMMNNFHAYSLLLEKKGAMRNDTTLFIWRL